MRTIIKSILIILLINCTATKTKRIRKNDPDKNITKNIKEISLKKKKLKKNKKLKKKKNRRIKWRTRIENNYIKNLSFNGLKKMKEKLLKEEQVEEALPYIERMALIAENETDLRDLRLELANIYFNLGKLTRAGNAYRNYSILYPGSKNLEYVHYKAILCNFYQTLESNRDQSYTNQTIQLAQNFLDKSNIFKTYNDEVKKIKNECSRKLFDSESNIFNFYLNKGNLKSAESRLAFIKKNFNNKMILTSIEPKILNLEIKLAERKGETKLAFNKKFELASRFPDFDTVKLSWRKRKTRTNIKIAQNKRKNIEKF